MSAYVIAVDFDGTLCENKYPEIGKPKQKMIDYLKKRQRDGARLVLWTCRIDELLDNAVRWSRNQGLIFDAVNENLPEIIAEFGTDTRKIFANEYIDDRNVWIPEEVIGISRDKADNTDDEDDMLSWAENEVRIACERERGDKPEDEWDYGCACYESALKAYKAIAEGGHSYFSWSMTRQIFDRLANGMPLTPIEDTDDAWNDISRFCGEDYSYTSYQCKRISSLFKHIYDDGRVEYKDLGRFYCCDKSGNGYGCRYYSGIVNGVMDEILPITMPYYPEDPIKVVCKEYLTDRKNGDFDTVCISHYIYSGSDRMNFVNRFYKEDNGKFVEITVEEYYDRVAMHKAREEMEAIQEKRGENQ